MATRAELERAERHTESLRRKDAERVEQRDTSLELAAAQLAISLCGGPDAQPIRFRMVGQSEDVQLKELLSEDEQAYFEDASFIVGAIHQAVSIEVSRLHTTLSEGMRRRRF